jgi:hypothetical protein
MLFARAGLAGPQANPRSGVLARVDHIVYGVPDLDAGIEEFEERTGVRPTPGGRHPGRGTRNALVALGPSSYLEMIGSDPGEPRPKRGSLFGVDGLDSPRIVTWAAKTADLEAVFVDAGKKGIGLGEVGSGSRKRPDGVLLTWRYTDPSAVVADGIVPFFIDWGQTEHPAAGAARGLRLVALRAEHPEAEDVQKMLRGLGLDLEVARGSNPGLHATIESPRGRIELH